MRRDFRTLAVSAALFGALAVSGCQTEGTFPYSSKSNAPIPPKLLADIADKNMDIGSPILVRVFKTESELEVWKQDRTGHYALLKTYPVCKWSGDLGPKIKEGDRQAPEGFYEITPGQMNPHSQFHLAFNLGYPNAYDRAHDRTGAHLMVHGDCSSRGCYAMSDEQITEIFALGRESFFGGQKSFQVQAYPFRMTAANMAKHRNNPNVPFWRMLKEGNDHFEVTRMEPKVDVCEKRYVFNGGAPAGSFTPLSFSPKGRCPVYEVPQEVASAVQAKQRNDDLQVAQLAARGTPTVPVRSGRDGGMHPTFVAKLQPREIIDERGNTKLVVDKNPSSVVAYNSPQPDSEITNSARLTAPIQVANVPLPRSAPQGKVTVAAAEPTFAEKMSNFFGLSSRRSEPPPPQTRVASIEPAIAPAPKPTPQGEGVKSKVSRMLGLRGSNDAPQTAEKSSSPKPAVARPANEAPKVKTAAAGEAQAPAPSSSNVISGAQPIPATSNFDSRWSAFR